MSCTHLVAVISQLSTTSSVDNFIEAKVKSISVHLAVNSKFKDIFGIAQKRKIFTDKKYNNTVKELQLEVD